MSPCKEDVLSSQPKLACSIFRNNMRATMVKKLIITSTCVWKVLLLCQCCRSSLLVGSFSSSTIVGVPFFNTNTVGAPIFDSNTLILAQGLKMKSPYLCFPSSGHVVPKQFRIALFKELILANNSLIALLLLQSWEKVLIRDESSALRWRTVGCFALIPIWCGQSKAVCEYSYGEPRKLEMLRQRVVLEDTEGL